MFRYDTLLRYACKVSAKPLSLSLLVARVPRAHNKNASASADNLTLRTPCFNRRFYIHG